MPATNGTPAKHQKTTTTSTSRKNLYKIQIMQDFIYIYRLFGHKNNMKMFGRTKVCNGNVRNVKMCGNYIFEGVQLCGWCGVRGACGQGLTRCWRVFKRVPDFYDTRRSQLNEVASCKGLESFLSRRQQNGQWQMGKWQKENGKSKIAFIMLCSAVSSGAINNL